jgi:D-lactate dehydrogenase
MKTSIAFFSFKKYEQPFYQNLPFECHYFEENLGLSNVKLAEGHPIISCFVNDKLNAEIINHLADKGLRLIALRCAGFNHVDLNVAKQRNVTIVRVPAYSPYAVAEHAVALILALNRKIHKAYNRVREGNFSLDGLTGFDLHGSTVGIIGTGKIGAVFAGIMKGFGCKIFAYDPFVNKDIEGFSQYVDLDTLLKESDIISLHLPLSPKTFHLIDLEKIEKMKPGAMLINTSRGGLVDTKAVIAGLKSGKIGSLGLDVYEEEEGLFFQDHSGEIILDDVLARLLTFNNVLITSHQAFLTQNALHNIADTTMENVQAFLNGEKLLNEVV